MEEENNVVCREKGGGRSDPCGKQVVINLTVHVKLNCKENTGLFNTRSMKF